MKAIAESEGDMARTMQLMHADDVVLTFSVAGDSYRADDIVSLDNLDAAPLSIWNDRLARVRDLDFAGLVNRWLARRGVPESRIGLDRALRDLGGNTARDLVQKASALSLSDAYWVRPADSSETWAHVNFFVNDFDEDQGRILAGMAVESPSELSANPSFTTDGNLPKMWSIDPDDTRVLLKSGSGVLRQEPFNEVAACVAYDLGLAFGSYVPYTLRELDYAWYSACPCMVDRHAELICARDIFYTHPLSCGTPTLDDMIRAGEALGIEGFGKSIQTQLVFDFILGNIDRHLGNFGAIRSAETLAFIGPAPVFDSGLSLLCHVVDRPQDVCELTSNPFFPRQSFQLAYVTDFSGVNLAALDGLGEKIAETLRACPSRYMDEERLAYITRFVDSGVAAARAAAESACAGPSASIVERAEWLSGVRAAELQRLGAEPVFFPGR